jgi:hypothetical protein
LIEQSQDAGGQHAALNIARDLEQELRLLKEELHDFGADKPGYEVLIFHFEEKAHPRTCLVNFWSNFASLKRN